MRSLRITAVFLAVLAVAMFLQTPKAKADSRTNTQVGISVELEPGVNVVLSRESQTTVRSGPVYVSTNYPDQPRRHFNRPPKRHFDKRPAGYHRNGPGDHRRHDDHRHGNDHRH
ncbi:MAG: hypothetical protein LBO05_02885 [Deltaproteobacteria bacterium]|nr:hypothetical protein [Deltaproteobacteria bacterium]